MSPRQAEEPWDCVIMLGQSQYVLQLEKKIVSFKLHEVMVD